ncbi:hypothetical protein [Mammaliicoccus sciuri]|uniref:hypothetical protein n=1 Tax=Mammaliicoccus sciuri TaxID=1296 RepID=UPI0034DD3AD6
MYKKLLPIGLATSILLAGCGAETENKDSETTLHEDKNESSKIQKDHEEQESITEMTITEIKNMRNYSDYEKVLGDITDFAKTAVERVYDKKGYIAAQEEQKVGSSTLKTEMDDALYKIENSHKKIMRILSSKDSPSDELSYAERYEVRENLEVIEGIYNQNK